MQMALSLMAPLLMDCPTPIVLKQTAGQGAAAAVFVVQVPPRQDSHLDVLKAITCRYHYPD